MARIGIIDTINVQQYPYAFINSNIDDSPNKELIVKKLARSNGARTVHSSLKERRINMRMRINAATLIEAEQALSRLKGAYLKGSY